MRKIQSYNIKGMRQDNLIGTGYSTQYASEIKNMRITTVGDQTTAVWQTEKGSTNETIYWHDNDNRFENYPFYAVGQAVIDDKWVLFGYTEENTKTDYIIYLHYIGDKLYCKVVYESYSALLDFNTEHPLETIVYYENEKIQKVYFICDNHQPRMVNIVSENIQADNNTQFDFVREFNTGIIGNVYKIQNSNGSFKAGTMQYAVTYFNKYGQETNIVWLSGMYYPTIGDRALSAEEVSSDAFKITIDNIDTVHGFEYLRLYSIYTSVDGGTPVVRIVDEKSIKNVQPYNASDIFHSAMSTVSFIDTNTTGAEIDYTILNYLGGHEIIAETFDQKDNTLFLGNIKLKEMSASQLGALEGSVTFVNADSVIPICKSANGFYAYESQLNGYGSREIKSFKYKEHYWFGVQFMTNKGSWSDVLPVTTNAFTNNTQPQYANNIDGFEYAVYPVNAQYTISTDMVNKAIDSGFVAARLVCAYPNNANRNVLAQGVLCPTIYNVKQRNLNAPYAMSSWFYRPVTKYDTSISWNESTPNVSTFYNCHNVIWRNNDVLPDNSCGNAEIQSTTPYTTTDDNYKYKVDWNILTFHSPDIQYDETLHTMPLDDNYSLYIVGKVSIDSYYSKYYLDADSPKVQWDGFRGSGFSDEANGKKINQIDTYHGYGSINLSAAKFDDGNVYYDDEESERTKKISKYTIGYKMYPFQRDTANNYVKDYTLEENDVSITQTTKINQKIFATTRYSIANTSITEHKIDISHSYLFNQDANIPIRLDNGNIYMGSMDSYVTLPKDSVLINSNSKFNGLYMIRQYNGSYIKSGNSDYVCSVDPVQMTYKSTPHIVVELSSFINNESFLNPQDSDLGDTPFLWLAELRRKNNISNVDTDELVYVPCGETFDLQQNTAVTLVGTEGDTYVQRYDNVKTLPYRTTDVNQIVDIMSFMCETRINLDGRYDRNRGITDCTIVSNSNFGLVNTSYTQNKKMFNYNQLIDKDTESLDNFTNQFTWTKTKVAGEDVDTWTNITLANVADADGSIGEITKIISQGNNLYLFQEHGVAQIGYNERTAVSVEDGVPLELANSGKFSGLSYISKVVGCQNKWSICKNTSDIIFIDDTRREITSIGSEGKSITTVGGFVSFMINELSGADNKWTPKNAGNFVTYYDKTTKDTYFMNANNCLAYNENVGLFTSFYDYTNVRYIANINDKCMMLVNGKNNPVYTARTSEQYGVYTEDVVKPYWMTVVCDGTGLQEGSYFTSDKIFDIVEVSGDTFNIEDSTPRAGINNELFNKIASYNGYQVYNEFELNNFSTEYPWVAQRKFNNWRYIIPRASYLDDNNDVYASTDRMRGRFAYIKLIQDDSSRERLRSLIHNINISYTVK